jgi:hypothetical protein
MGLGVPLWRLPWDVMARAVGHEAFPDRIAFGLFAALVAFVVLKVWMGPLAVAGSDASFRWRNGIEEEALLPGEGPAIAIGAVGVLVLLLLFPPFIGLLQARGPAWGEPVTYQYLYGILLVTLLVAWARRPRAFGWLILCVLAGLGGLIRPTLFFYGLVTMLIGTWVWLRIKRAGVEFQPVAEGLGTRCNASLPGSWRAAVARVSSGWDCARHCVARVVTVRFGRRCVVVDEPQAVRRRI